MSRYPTVGSRWRLRSPPSKEATAISTDNDAVADAAGRGAELAIVAESLLAEASLDVIDTAHAAELAKANALLAIYWELRHQRETRDAPAEKAPDRKTPSPPADDQQHGIGKAPHPPEPGA